MIEQRMQILVKKVKVFREKLTKLIIQMDTAISGYSEECEQISQEAMRAVKPQRSHRKAKKKKISG